MVLSKYPRASTQLPGLPEHLRNATRRVRMTLGLVPAGGDLMRKRLGTLVAVSALVFAACGGTTPTVAPSAVSSAPATTQPSAAATPVPSEAPPPIDITATKYK